MIKATPMKNEIPVCPHCSVDLNDVWFRDLPTTFGRRYIYFCSNCRKVLSISDRKGNFMS